VLDIEREQDIERLRAVARLQKSQLEHLIAMLARKCAELEKLKGSGGELQIALKLLEEAQQEAAKLDEPAAPSGAKKKAKGEQRGHGPTEQSSLPRVPLRCELGETERECPSCHGTLKPLAGQAERSEMLDVVELKYQLVEVERQKYVCACGGAVETAPGPMRAVDGGRYSLRFAIKVAFDKYVAHLPLERQVSLMAHHGLNVTSQTLWDQCSAVTELLAPTYDALFALLRASPVVGVDQTGWPDLEDPSLPPWQMWCVTAPGLVYHRICDDKSARTFKDLLGDYEGWVVADALGSHEAGARECRGLKLAACWAHVLRRFRDAVVDFSEAQFMLAWIQDLYVIDARATDSRDRARLRSTESRAVEDEGLDAGHDGAEDHDPGRSHPLHARHLESADALSRRSGDLAGQQPHRTRATRASNRAPESLRVQVRARHRGRRDHVQPRRVRQSCRRGSHRLPRRGRDACEAHHCCNSPAF
jgi:transposase